MPDLLQEALSAKQRGDNTMAKQLLSQALIQDPNDENAWMLMADVVDNVRLRRNCLERILVINPRNLDASAALTKLDTSPLGPVQRGERDKPLIQPDYSKIPPFTPPNTWGGIQEQYLDLVDLAYAEPQVEQIEPVVDTTPTFDWANDSDEPDKTIDRLFHAVSNPELATQPLEDTDLSWLEENQHEPIPLTTEIVTENRDAIRLDEMVETDVAPLPDSEFDTIDTYPVSAEVAPVVEAVIAPEPPVEATRPEYKVWDNSKAKRNRMLILSNTAMIYANPKESDLPHIYGLLLENRMMRDLLGKNAGTIKLENLRRLSADPKNADLAIDYLNKDGKASTQKFIFSSPQERDEVIATVREKPGVNFNQSIQTFRLEDKIVPPLAILVFLIFLIWLLFTGLPMLSNLTGGELGILQSFISTLQNYIWALGRTNLLFIILIIGALIVIWLISNLMKPTTLQVFEKA